MNSDMTPGRTYVGHRDWVDIIVAILRGVGRIAGTIGGVLITIFLFLILPIVLLKWGWEKLTA